MISDATTINIIRRFIASAKPSGITPVDVLMVLYFMLTKSEDHPVNPSLAKQAVFR